MIRLLVDRERQISQQRQSVDKFQQVNAFLKSKMQLKLIILDFKSELNFSLANRNRLRTNLPGNLYFKPAFELELNWNASTFVSRRSSKKRHTLCSNV